MVNDKKKRYPNSLPLLRIVDSCIRIVVKSTKNTPVKNVLIIKPNKLRIPPSKTRTIPIMTNPTEILRSLTLSLK